MSTVVPVGAREGLPVQEANPEGSREGGLHDAAVAFEALLVQALLSRMRDAQLEGGFFGEGPGSAIYEGLLVERLSEQVASTSPLGIARMLEEQWSGRPPEENVLGRVDALRAGRIYAAAPGEAQVPGGQADE